MIKPLGKRVLIKPKKEEKVTASGIVLPEKDNEKSDKGEVVAVGEEIANLKGGETVLIPKYHQVKFDHEGEEYIIMHIDEIFAVLN